METLETIRADFITDLVVVDLGAKATRKEDLAQKRKMEEKIEAYTREFRSQLEGVKAVAERGSKQPAQAQLSQQPSTGIRL
jgi:hypothetical protein